jgi:hypothetical protein
MVKRPNSIQKNRRRATRYPGLSQAVVSFGKKKGTVIDVSKGGLAIHFDEQYIFPGYKNQIDLEWASQEFFLGAIPVRAISHLHAMEKPCHGDVATHCGVAFDVLRLSQRFKLDYFIWLCIHPSP